MQLVPVIHIPVISIPTSVLFKKFLHKSCQYTTDSIHKLCDEQAKLHLIVVDTHVTLVSV